MQHSILFKKWLSEKIREEQGFSLIEILVSMVILILIIGGITLFGVRTIQYQTKSAVMQNSLENARFAMEKLNKTLRTSSIVRPNNLSSNSNQVIFIDNRDGEMYCYRIYNKKLMMAEGETNCTSGGGYVELVGDDQNQVSVTGGFFVKPTKAGQQGFVQTRIVLNHPDDPNVPPSERSKVTIQSGVSLRDY